MLKTPLQEQLIYFLTTKETEEIFTKLYITTVQLEFCFTRFYFSLFPFHIWECYVPLTLNNIWRRNWLLQAIITTLSTNHRLLATDKQFRFASSWLIDTCGSIFKISDCLLNSKLVAAIAVKIDGFENRKISMITTN